MSSSIAYSFMVCASSSSSSVGMQEHTPCTPSIVIRRGTLADSQLYVKFRLLCCEAFNILRRPSASNLILNLLLLMVDGDVRDLKSEQDVVFVTERFCLNMTNEEASRYFQETINASVSALFPQIVEKIHSLAQAWRQ